MVAIQVLWKCEKHDVTLIFLVPSVTSSTVAFNAYPARTKIAAIFFAPWAACMRIQSFVSEQDKADGKELVRSS